MDPMVRLLSVESLWYPSMFTQPGCTDRMVMGASRCDHPTTVCSCLSYRTFADFDCSVTSC